MWKKWDDTQEALGTPWPPPVAPSGGFLERINMASKDLVKSFPSFLFGSSVILGFVYNFSLLKVLIGTFKQNKCLNPF